MKPIPHYPAYSIDEAGTVIINNNPNRNKDHLVIADQMRNGKPTGYKFATLIKDSIPKRCSIHRLVALTYLPNPDNLREVNHKDMNKGNNHVSNLEWCSHQDNIIHSFANGRVHPSGANSKLTGTKRSLSTRLIQSEQKKGVKHPKFKGYYVVNHIKYTSLTEAAIANKCSRNKINYKCKAGQQGSDYYFLAMEWVNV